MKFTLEIEMGNEAMQTVGDLSRALKMTAVCVSDAADLKDRRHGANEGGIRDANGNKVGTWRIVD